MALTPLPTPRLFRRIWIRAVMWGVLAALLTFLISALTGGWSFAEGWCVGCAIQAAGAPAAAAAAGAAGAGVGGKYLGDLFDKNLGPLSPYMGVYNAGKTMYDIASQETDEGKQEKAFDAYEKLIMIKHAPEGSVGGDIKEQIDKFIKISKGDWGF